MAQVQQRPVADDGPSKVRFLLSLADRFEADGNAAEFAKAAETALLTRLGLPEEEQQAFAVPLPDEATRLVSMVNALGVAAFQRGDYDLGLVLLHKALFLTGDSPATNAFVAAEHDRLRLRAATYNNLGCLEKRRDRIEPSLEHLQKAAELEGLVDPDVGPAPSTLLNLCAALNRVARHAAAAAAASRAVKHLQLQLQNSTPSDVSDALAPMLMLAHYNLGVSLEFAARPGDLPAARQSYSRCLFVGHQHGIAVEAHQTGIAAQRAMARIDGVPEPSAAAPTAHLRSTPTSRPSTRDSRPAADPSIPGRAAEGRVGGLPALPAAVPRVPTKPTLPAFEKRPGPGKAGLAPLSVPPPSKLLPNAATLSARIPHPPGSAPARGTALPVPLSARGASGQGSPLSASVRSAAAPKRGTKLDSAMERHRARMHAKTDRKQAAAARHDGALRKAQALRERESRDKQRRAEEHQAAQREQQARQLYEKMEAGLRAERARTLREAAKKIQRMWRGFLVRDYIRILADATVRIQATVRSFLCRKMLQRLKAEERAREALQAEARRTARAVLVLQKAARYLLHRCQCVRMYRARVLRRRCSVRIIETAYRAYRARERQRRIEAIEMERRAEEGRIARVNDAARKIQGMYLAFRSRRFMRVVRQEQQRRAGAATKVQAQMRGSLTRAWFRHYRLFRRRQELSTAANVRAICAIQRAWRCHTARRVRRALELRQAKALRAEAMFRAARRIQCAWRCHASRRTACSLRLERRLRTDAASTIQSIWLMAAQRARYLLVRNAHRRARAARRLQRWWRDLCLRWSQERLAAYHAAVQQREREALARTRLSMMVQSCLRARDSELIVESVWCDYARRSTFAALMQRVARGFHARTDTAKLRRIAAIVVAREKEHHRRTGAARVLQRAVRVYQAKCCVGHRRCRLWSAMKLQSWWRMVLAIKAAQSIRDRRVFEVRDLAARRIQRSFRLYIRRRELHRLDAYYSQLRRHKQHQQRRAEATVTIQAAWKGHATRRATQRLRQRHVERVVAATCLQRAYRARLFRQRVNKAVALRIQRRAHRQRAALKVQSFWRMVLAGEYTQLLRERHFHRTCAAVAMQTAWRAHAARRRVSHMRATRDAQRVRLALRHGAWAIACTCVSTVLRARVSEQHCVALRETQLREAVWMQQQLRTMRLDEAATKIQARYRGHYERCYARGVRHEARIAAAAKREQIRRREGAALTLQLAWRQYAARRRLYHLREAKRLTQVEELLRREETSDPHTVVRQLFWAHEAAVRRDITAERRERHELRTRAVVHLQRMVRGFLARCRARRIQESRVRGRSARAIQAWFRRRQRLETVARLAQREQRATKVASLVRRFLVMKQFRMRRPTLDGHRADGVAQEDTRDRCATTIQAVYRGVLARRYCAELLGAREVSKDDRTVFEAARLAQRHVRFFLARVRKARAEGTHDPAGGTAATPASVSLGGGLAPRPPSEGRGDARRFRSSQRL